MHMLQTQAKLDKPVQHCILWQQLALALAENAIQVTCIMIG